MGPRLNPAPSRRRAGARGLQHRLVHGPARVVCVSVEPGRPGGVRCVDCTLACARARRRKDGREPRGSAAPAGNDAPAGTRMPAACCSPWPRPSCSIVLFSFSDRKADRFIFPAYYFIAAAGGVAAIRYSPCCRGWSIAWTGRGCQPHAGWACFCCASSPAHTCHSSRSGGRDEGAGRWALGAGRCTGLDDGRAVGAGRSAMDGRLAVARDGSGAGTSVPADAVIL